MSRSRRARAARTGLNRDGPCSVGPRYGLAMRLNYLAAGVSFVTSVVFFLTGNIAIGAVFLAVGAVFVAVDQNAPREPGG